MTFRHIAVAATAVLVAGPVAAQDFNQAMSEFMSSELAGWQENADIVAAINAQNQMTAGYDADQIDQMDQAWRAEVAASERPTIDPVLQNELSEFLRAQVEASGGMITEIFVMDGVGLNVAASDVTSDMYQGDEAKWSETYAMGPGSVHFGEIEFDDSSQRYQGQISFSVTDPDTGEAVGAVTVGVDAESLL